LKTINVPEATKVFDVLVERPSKQMVH
jgi:hypothetical protein